MTGVCAGRLAAAALLTVCGAQHEGLDWLVDSVPGVPGEDYPVYSAVPDTGFSCEGRVQGGKYADPGAECQVGGQGAGPAPQAFHVCALSDAQGGLTQYSFLCPNGTVFQQQYFICDWWFNVDCSLAEDLFSLNDEIAAESAGAGGGGGGSGGGPPLPGYSG
jgi:hypothetical protein